MTNEKWYKLFCSILRPVVRLLFPQNIKGLENVPQGPALICPNHSNAVDPILVSVAMGPDVFVHHFAKAESKKIFLFGWIMRKIGSIFVKRGERDIDSFKQCLRALKSGEKLLVFPEGTRVHGDERTEAKTGVIHMAAKTNTPIVPVYLTRDKKVFKRSVLVFGEPYCVSARSHDEYETAAAQLMDRIWELKDHV